MYTLYIYIYVYVSVDCHTEVDLLLDLNGWMLAASFHLSLFKGVLLRTLSESGVRTIMVSEGNWLKKLVEVQNIGDIEAAKANQTRMMNMFRLPMKTEGSALRTDSCKRLTGITSYHISKLEIRCTV